MIAPACSGANFALVLFTALAAGYLVRLRSARQKLAWVLGALALAYFATVLTNTVRITLAATLRVHPLFDAGVSHATAHRALGVSVYLGALLALDRAAGWLLGVPRKNGSFALVCYLGVTLVTPLLGGAYASGVFWTHAALVLGATSVAAAVLWLWRAHALASRRAQGVASDTRVHRRVLRARRDGEHPLPGQRGAALVPLTVD
jgi:exosortase/archaeosortase family protein